MELGKRENEEGRRGGGLKERANGQTAGGKVITSHGGRGRNT
jgi:hypothetical protein